MLKYGGNGTTEILICDRIVNDRIISHIIRLLIVPQKSFDELKKHIKTHSETIFNVLDNYPIVFSEKIKQMIENGRRVNGLGNFFVIY